jgi:hypothetical protein
MNAAFLIRITLVSLAVLVALGGLTRADDTEFERRLARLAPDDYDGRFKLALWGMGMGEKAKRQGRDLFEDIAFSTGGDLGAKALYRLGLYHLTQGRTYWDRKRAARLLLKAADFGNEAAARRVTELKTEFGERKQNLLEKADRLLASRRFDTATRTLRDAYRLPLGVGSLSDPAVLERLAFAYAEMGKELRRLDDKKVQPACPVCAGTGFQPCRKCKGTGKVKKKKPPELVTGIEGSSYKKGETVDVKCAFCKGTGGEPCRTCGGLGLNFEILPESSHKALRAMAASIKRISKRKDPWDAIRKTWARVVANRLHIPAGYNVSTVSGTDKFIPPDVTLVDRPSLKKFWEAAGGQEKHRFLLGFTGLSAQYLRPIFMHDRARNTLRTRAPLDLAPSTMPLDIETVAALPEIFHDRWIAIQGKISRSRGRRGKKGGTDWDDDSFKWVFLKGRGRTPLRCFYWTPIDGREKHTLLAKLKISDAFRHLERFVWAYPYQDVEEQVTSLRRECEVVVFGRFIYNPLGIDAALFEIWSLDLVREDKGRTVTWHPGSLGRAPSSTAEPAVRSGYLLLKGLHFLRDEAWNRKRRKKKGDEAAEIEKRRGELRVAAIGAFREARSILETAAFEANRIDAYLEEQLAQVNRELDRVLIGSR